MKPHKTADKAGQRNFSAEATECGHQGVNNLIATAQMDSRPEINKRILIQFHEQTEKTKRNAYLNALSGRMISTFFGAPCFRNLTTKRRPIAGKRVNERPGRCRR